MLNAGCRNYWYPVCETAWRGTDGTMSESLKLAAILVADIVGYRRLAGADEDCTLARLRGPEPSSSIPRLPCIMAAW